ncbi:hypothetical protein D9615_005344 [Tricholomella constricta]|uniref:Uncharacterized protein n=1 Tax=Tricholomella constricta TaxID=117010 RepID=A0A8H5H647_9AGAR|nr:hypothetical protein D9615_005344 [Tricholomella constricta]
MASPYPYASESSSHPSPSGSSHSASLPEYNHSTPYIHPPPYSLTDQSSAFPPSRTSTSRVTIAHPYARLYAKKEQVKRRKIWNHALEKSLFSPYEISTIGAPQRRTIYISSLEAHIDKLHSQLLDIGFWPVAFDQLEPYRGLNSKTAKSIVSGLQHDASVAKLKLLELERANQGLQKTLQDLPVAEHVSGSVPQPTTHYNYFQS